MRAGSYAGRSSAIAATVVTEPARPTRVRARVQRHRPAATSSAASMSARAAADLGGGRGRVASQVPLGHPHAADVDASAPPRPSAPSTNSVEPPPMSTTRNGAAVPAGQLAGGAGERQPASCRR